MSKKRTSKKNKPNKYKIKIAKNNNDNRNAPQIIIADYSYAPIQAAFTNSFRNEVFKKYVNELSKTHGISENDIDYTDKINKLMDINEVNKLLKEKQSVKDISLEANLIEMFHEPFPYVSHEDYIANKMEIVLNGECECEKTGANTCATAVEKEAESFSETLATWAKMLPQMEKQVIDLFKGSYSRKQIAVWQGFFRDKAFTPLISSFLEVIHYVEMRNWDEAELADFLIKNLPLAFKIEKDFVAKKIISLEEMLLNNSKRISHNKRGFFDYFLKNTSLAFEETAERIFDNDQVDICSDYELIFNEIEESEFPERIMKTFKKFVVGEEDLIFKFMNYNFIALIFDQNFKKEIFNIRFGQDLDCGQYFLENLDSTDFNYVFTKRKLVNEMNKSIRLVIKLYLTFIEDIYLSLSKDINLIDKKTWDILSILLKNTTIKHSVLGAVYINTIKTGWTSQEKSNYLKIALKIEVHFLKNILALDKNNFYIWLNTSKYCQ